MTTDDKAGLALTLGSIAGVAIMALHPTGRDVVANAAAGGHNALNVAVHAVAIAALPLLVLGTLQLTRRLDGARDLAVSAFVLYALYVVAILVAAGASGFVATGVVAHGGADVSAMLHYTGLVNRAFATIGVGFASAAIVLWSVAASRTGFSRALGVYGVVSGLLVAGGVAVGHLRLDVHGFGVVMVLQAVWMVWAGLLLRRRA